MENIGADIRRQREAKHLTIEELSQRTKISVAVLHDIEDLIVIKAMKLMLKCI